MKEYKQSRKLGFNFDISRISDDLKVATAALDKVSRRKIKNPLKIQG